MLGRFLAGAVLIAVLVGLFRLALRHTWEDWQLLQEQHQRKQALQERLAVMNARLEAQSRRFDRLFLGQMSLREAVGELRAQRSKEDLETLIRWAGVDDEGSSLEEALYRYLLLVLRLLYASDPGRPGSEAAPARWQAEFDAYMREHQHEDAERC